MSHFIAHTISFSKDFQTFRVKGGDNNVVPRFNEWSNEIPIDRLYYNLNGGMIKLNGTSEKNCFIRSLVNETEFGGNWENSTDYFHMKNSDKPEDQEAVRAFDTMFIERLVEGMKNLSNKCGFIIYLKHVGTYVYKANPTSVLTTMYRESAKAFTQCRGAEITRAYAHKGARLLLR